MLAYSRLEILRTLRSVTYLAYHIAFPVMFYLLFTTIFDTKSVGGLDFGTHMMVSMAFFGAFGAGVSGLGARIAMERANKWTDQLAVTPLTSPAYLAAKVFAAAIVMIPIVLLVLAIGTVINSQRLAPGTWILVAVTDERVRFARDLHDILGQRLSAAALRAELAGRTAASDPERSAREAFAASELAREALADVRQAVTGYRRTTLADEVETATVLLNATGVDVVAKVPSEPLPEGVDELAGWVVREGATNVARHAHAERCWITVTGTSPYTVTVSDDGGGADSGWGNGLTGLAERLEPHGGELVTAEHGGRFELRATIPGESAA
ncbi:histidine kinase [Tenggerimyces flavus]|uniref:Histidine kinase n=1 Tax=Tenggerimyces flavus TaxID=1708749 RepID=A0ABV7YKG0_9ACTN|nr:histidine kinase [Tenggerimyces flavus]MBM7787485.1 signal transduction histidine kinase [Tenggerimyces flavus]